MRLGGDVISPSPTFEMQLLNRNQPVTSLDVSSDGGKTWQGTVRKDYNYFQKAGRGGRLWGGLGLG